MTIEEDYLTFLDPTSSGALAAELRDSILHDIAQAWAANLRAARDLALLPQYLVTRAGVEIYISEPRSAASLGATQQRAVAQIQRMASEPDVAESLRAVRRAVLIEVWTAFECLANDCREALRPNQVKNARGLKSIRESYSTAFGEKTAEFFEVFQRPLLHELAEVRHLLVHRAGMVDRKYLSQGFSDEPLGTRVRIDGTRVMRLAEAAIGAGNLLLAILHRQELASN